MNQRNNKNNHNNKGKQRSSNHDADSKTVYRDVAMTGIDNEMVLIANDTKKFDKNTWIADAGATTHMINRLDGMFGLEGVNVSILVGDEREMTKKKVLVNLFSLTAVMEKGCLVSGTKEGIDIQKDSGKSNLTGYLELQRVTYSVQQSFWKENVRWLS